MLRIFRSPRAVFEQDPDLADQVYTEDELRRLADSGFNAVWVRVIMRKLLKHPKYPSFGEDSERLVSNLNTVIERGARAGVKLVVYCQEPFGLPVDDPFWTEHPEMAGADYPRGNLGTGDEPFYMRAFCVSSPPVREYLEDSSANLLRALPGLGGIVTITASEFISHCFSHYGKAGIHMGDAKPEPLRCPRCRERQGTDVVVDTLNSMRAGMNRVAPETPLIAWNWSWIMYEDDPQPSILTRLDPGIDLLADFERGDFRTDPLGKTIEVNEYSLSYVGPSERFMKIRAVALDRGMRVGAKLQFGTTHELATVSNLPLIGNIHDKAKRFAALDPMGFMGCWNFGNHLSLNTRAFNYCLSAECPEDRDQALLTLAEREFPGVCAGELVRAWELFGQAFEYYPFSIPFLYTSPINYSLALPMTPGPLHEKCTGRSWLLDPRHPDDDPASSFGPFTPEEVVERFGHLCRVWGQGLGVYEQALAVAEGGAAEEELGVARAVYACVRSVGNYYALYLLKRDWSDDCLERFRQIAGNEIEVLDCAIPVYEADPRQGFHIEGHGYMVTPELMRAKREQLLAYM